jgi:hypothetical protein
METLRRFIYEEREKEKTEFTNFVFPNYSEEEINRRLRHRSGGKYLRVETAGTLRFGVRAMEDIPMSIEEDSYICVYSDVIIDKSVLSMIQRTFVGVTQGYTPLLTTTMLVMVHL